MRKTMTIVAGLAVAMLMTFASAALAQAPVDVDDPYFQPTEEPTDGGGVGPIEVTAPPREEPEPSRQQRPEPALAETGMTASVGLVAGVGLLAAGGGLLVMSRRRKSTLQ